MIESDAATGSGKCQEERLKIAIHYVIGKNCDDLSKDFGDVQFSPAFIASLTECLYCISQEWTKDLEAFANHAKRSTITLDDLKLLTRKNDDLSKIICKYLNLKHEQASKNESAEKTKGGRGRKKNTANSPNNPKAQIDENSASTFGDHCNIETDSAEANSRNGAVTTLKNNQDTDVQFDFAAVQNFDDGLDLFD